MADFDCALFDVDGVLVDIRKSYNEAIKKAVEFVLLQVSGKKYKNLVSDGLILKFRQAGGFNNDTDTTYAIALAMLANPQKTITAARKFLMQVAQNADETGILSVEKFLSGYGIEKHRQVLVYPAPVKDSYVGRVFDELFYGPELFQKQNGLEPKYCRPARPFIKNDRLVVSKKTMKILHDRFDGKLAIVSGRSWLAAEYSLKPIIDYFNIDACVFLEDEKREYAKPSPYAVKRAMGVMKAKTAVYAGDSEEDMLMARRAEKETGKISFVGIYGFSPQPAKTAKLFKEHGAEAICKSVDSLPTIINKVLAT
jgi:phosphoglycolate phosphatase-like HAD superfamily hydrolase